MIVLLYSDGILSINDILKECKIQKWFPICAQGNTVIGFNDPEIAKKFAKRNFPKNWIRGGIRINENDINWIKSQNWSIEILNWPKLMKDLSFLIFETQEEMQHKFLYNQ